MRETREIRGIREREEKWRKGGSARARESENEGEKRSMRESFFFLRTLFSRLSPTFSLSTLPHLVFLEELRNHGREQASAHLEHRPPGPGALLGGQARCAPLWRKRERERERERAVWRERGRERRDAKKKKIAAVDRRRRRPPFALSAAARGTHAVVSLASVSPSSLLTHNFLLHNSQPPKIRCQARSRTPTTESRTRRRWTFPTLPLAARRAAAEERRRAAFSRTRRRRAGRRCRRWRRTPSAADPARPARARPRPASTPWLVGARGRRRGSKGGAPGFSTCSSSSSSTLLLPASGREEEEEEEGAREEAGALSRRASLEGTTTPRRLRLRSTTRTTLLITEGRAFRCRRCRTRGEEKFFFPFFKKGERKRERQKTKREKKLTSTFHGKKTPTHAK